MTEDERLRQKYIRVLPHLNERQRRLVSAADAQLLGYGGIARVARASGLDRSTLYRGERDLAGAVLPAERVRQEGGGRKRISEQQPEILQALEQLVDPVTRGDPQSPLRWTCKSTRQLARTLTGQGYEVSYRVVGEGNCTKSVILSFCYKTVSFVKLVGSRTAITLVEGGGAKRGKGREGCHRNSRLVLSSILPA